MATAPQYAAANSNHPLQLVSKSVAEEIILGNLPTCMRLVRDAYLAHHAGNTVVPKSTMLRMPHQTGARIMALPAHSIGPPAVSGIKWIASYPANVRNDVPRASGLIILNRCDDGFPYAVLEASAISAARTAASAALAANVLFGDDLRAERVGIIGSGLISRWVWRFLAASRVDCKTLYVHDVSEAAAGSFRDEVQSAPNAPEVVICDAPTAIRASQLVALATVATTPHITDPRLFEHNPVVLHLSLRDLSPEVIVAARNIVDDVEHVMSTGTSVQLAEAHCGGRQFLAGTLAEYLSGARRPERSHTLIFSPYGLGILDLVMAQWLSEVAGSHSAVGTQNGFFS